MCSSVTLKLRDALPPLTQVCNPLSLAGASIDSQYVNLESIASEGYGLFAVIRGEQALFLSPTPEQNAVSDVTVFNLTQHVTLDSLQPNPVEGLARISDARQYATFSSAEESYGLGDIWVSFAIREIAPDAVDSMRVQRVRLTKTPVITTQSYQLGATATPITYACPGLTHVETPTQSISLDYVLSWRWGLPEVRNLYNLAFGLTGVDAGAIGSPTVYNFGSQFVTPDAIPAGVPSDIWVRESDNQEISFAGITGYAVGSPAVSLHTQYVAPESVIPPAFSEGYSVTHSIQYVAIQSVVDTGQVGSLTALLKDQTVVLSGLNAFKAGSLSIVNRNRNINVFGANGFATTPFSIANVSASIRPNSVPLSYAVSRITILDFTQRVQLGSIGVSSLMGQFDFSPKWVSLGELNSLKIGNIAVTQLHRIIAMNGGFYEAVSGITVPSVQTITPLGAAPPTILPFLKVTGTILPFTPQNIVIVVGIPPKTPSRVTLLGGAIQNPYNPDDETTEKAIFPRSIPAEYLSGGIENIYKDGYIEPASILPEFIGTSFSIETLHRTISGGGVEGWIQPDLLLKYTGLKPIFSPRPHPPTHDWVDPSGQRRYTNYTGFYHAQIAPITINPQRPVFFGVDSARVSGITIGEAGKVVLVGVAPPPLGRSFKYPPKMIVRNTKTRRYIFQDKLPINRPQVRIGAITVTRIAV